MVILWQLFNVIIVVCILFVVVFFVLLLFGGMYGDLELVLCWMVVIFFIVGILIDWVDGYFVCRYDIVSDFGKLWDLIVDKLFIGVGFVGFVIFGEVNWWIVVIIFVCEWGIMIY